MMDLRNTLWTGDGYRLFGSAVGLLFALLAIVLLLYDAGADYRLSIAPVDAVHEILDGTG